MVTIMKHAPTLLTASLVCFLALTFNSVNAQNDAEAKIKEATSAAPDWISANAKVLDWPAEEGADFTVLREGTSDWTCLTSMPMTEGLDPMCIDAPWMAWLKAFASKSEFEIDQMGFGYMLQANSPGSNVDPFATGPTDDNEWLGEGMPHLMLIAPDVSTFDGMPRHPSSGHPWVMWENTPYVHVMVPMPEHTPGK
jgi:hypothetical protein